MISPLGKVWLGSGASSGTQFTSDPHIQRSWPPRRSRLQGIQGSSMQQDFGRWASDMRLTLTSQGNVISHDFKAYIESLMFERLGLVGYLDYDGVDADVVIVDFTPMATFIGDPSTARGGEGNYYEYTLVLDVVTLRKLDFVTYTGH